MLLIAGLLACTCLQPALAVPVAYDEAVDGDLSIQNGFAMPALTFDVGTNTIKGAFTGATSTEFDNLVFFVPSGLVVTSGSVTLADVRGDVTIGIWVLRSGSNVIGDGTPIGTVEASSPGSATIPGLPFGGTTYNMRHTTIGSTNLDAVGSYVFEFVVQASPAPVAEPAATLMLGAGLAALGLARRRSA